VSISKLHEGLEFITNGVIVPILDVVRALLAMAPCLEASCGDADDEGGAGRNEKTFEQIATEAQVQQDLGLCLPSRC
jgi:hypothetical protein